VADTRGIRAGRAFVELGVNDKLAAGLRRAQQRLEAFGESVRNIGLRLAGIGSAVTAALFGAARLFVSTGDDLDEMSQRTGVSVEALSELGYAADLAGGDLATLESGLKFMQRAIVEAQHGSAAATDVLRELGLTVSDLAGLSPDEQFKRLADRIAAIEDPAKRVSVAMRLFGRSGTQLLPLLAEGANGIEALQQSARKLGLTVSTEAARDAAELSDALDTLWRVVRQGAFAIGAILAPTFKDLAERATRIVVAATDWIKRNREVVIWALKVAAVVAAVGIVLIALGVMASIAATGLGLLAGAITGVGAAAGVLGAVAGALLSPVGLAVAAVVALGAAILITSGAGGEALSWLMARFAELRDWVGKVVTGISDALAAGDIRLAAEILWLALKAAWQEGVAALNSVWLEAKQFFISTAYSMWYGALAAAESVFHALEVAWIETTSFLSKTWTRFTSGFQSVWESASAFVAKRMLEIQGLFDAGLNVEAAKRAVDEQLDARLSEIDERAQGDLAEREARRAQDRERAGAVHEETLAAIGQEFEDARAALEAGTEEGIARSRAALDETRQRLDEALAEARAEREAADVEGSRSGLSPDLLSRFEDQIDGLGDLFARGISVRGTFNPAGIAGLASGNESAERTARATEQTARNTRRLVDMATTTGLAFT
jgi:TP901 family phage tail tape measure protein